MYHQTVAAIKSVFKNIPFSLTTDGWKARTKEPFYSVTFHCVKDFKIYNITLTCAYFDQSATSKNITSFLTSVLGEYDFSYDNCISITRDNAPNMDAAFREMDFVNFPCIDHSLNFLAKELFIDSLINESFRQINAIRKKFSYYHTRNKQLKIEQKALNLNESLFPSECETRWWSSFEVVKFFIKNKKAIDACLACQSLFKKKE